MTEGFDIKKHSLVPEHIKLNEEEKEEVLKKLNIKQNKLPMILSSDPAIEHLESENGDVIKIVRNSPSAKSAIFYRVVVNG